MKPSIIEKTSRPVKRFLSAFEGTQGEIINALVQHGEMSVAQIARKTNISPSAASIALTSLRRRGLIKQRGGKQCRVLNEINMQKYNEARAAIATCAASLKNIK